MKKLSWDTQGDPYGCYIAIGSLEVGLAWENWWRKGKPITCWRTEGMFVLNIYALSLQVFWGLK